MGSYPVPEWLLSTRSEEARIDATRVVFAIQRQAGIDLPTDGELSRFDPNHPDTNGMIDYFVGRLSGVRTKTGRADWEAARAVGHLKFRHKPAGVIEGTIGEGSMNLAADCEIAATVAGGPFKFTVTSPYQLARTLLDQHYCDFEAVTMAIAEALARQVRGLCCDTLQVDEANIPGNPKDGRLAARAMNMVLRAFEGRGAVHLCFGNYGGQVVQHGHWSEILDFLNALDADHLIMEIAHRPVEDLEALRGVDARIKIGVGVIDVKVNEVETPETIARRIEAADKALGPGRVRWVHPDCGFWMLKRSIVDRKIAALPKGRDLYLGRAKTMTA